MKGGKTMKINNISSVSSKANYLAPFENSLKLSNKRTLYIKGDKNYLEALVTKKNKNGQEVVIGGYQAAKNNKYCQIHKALFLSKISKNIMEARKFLDECLESQHL